MKKQFSRMICLMFFATSWVYAQGPGETLWMRFIEKFTSVKRSLMAIQFDKAWKKDALEKVTDLTDKYSEYKDNPTLYNTIGDKWKSVKKRFPKFT